jgi:HNH endonuclease
MEASMARTKTNRIPPNLFQVLGYDARNGKLFWKIKTHSYGGMIFPGDEAGSVKDGYIQVKVDGVPYRAHRLVWYMMAGDWLPPKQDIDHINGDRSDNRWRNLRLATRSENNHNHGDKLPHHNKSGYRGVSWRSDTGKWHARIQIDGHVNRLGDYETKPQAIAAREKAERQYLRDGTVDVPSLLRSDNTSGHRGVYWRTDKEKWCARIEINGRTIFRGDYKDKSQAVAARERAERELL